MKIKTEVLVTKVDLKQKKDGGAYLLVDMLDMKSGDLFNILHKTVEDMQRFSVMQKVDVTLNLTSSKYGLSLTIDKVGEPKGEI